MAITMHLNTIPMEWVLVMVKPIFTFQWNHLLTNTMFYDLKISSTKNYSGGYLHENPLIAIMFMTNILKVLVLVFLQVVRKKIMKKELLII